MPSRRESVQHYDTELPSLWVSPFEPSQDSEDKSEGDNENDQILEYDFDGFHTYPDKKPWADLLIDISMTTTFNSLTNGTKVLDGRACLSYVLFFTLVWWMWASRVAYDVRFTKGDWVHRVFLLLQFVIFCALAAFTKDFDIEYNLASDEGQQAVVQAQQLQNYSQAEIDVVQFRSDRISMLNAKGISLVLMLGRLLLLFQYLLVSLHAPNMSSSTPWYKKLRIILTETPFRSFQTHIVSLAISTVFFLVAFIVLDSSVGADKGSQAVKIGLWYLPVLLEIAAHYLALCQPGHVPYPMKGIFERSAAAFVIILGGGLDNITEGFQLLIGNSVIGGRVAALILSSAVIFIVQFSMYFELISSQRVPWRHTRSHMRTLTWFFFHFMYFASIIVLLQAIASILAFEDTATALELPLRAVQEANVLLVETGGSRNLTDDDFTIGQDMRKLGLDIGEFVELINDGIATGRKTNQSELNSFDVPELNTTVVQVAGHAALQGGVSMMVEIFNNFDNPPDTNDPLGAYMLLLLNTTINRTDFPYDGVYGEILLLAYAYSATPALWFFGSAGATLITLSILSTIRWWKERNVRRHFINYMKFVVGILTGLLSFLDIGHGNGTLSEDLKSLRLSLSGSPIYMMTSKSLIIPSFAFILVCEQAIEFIFLFVMRMRLIATTIKAPPERNSQDTYARSFLTEDDSKQYY